MSEGFCSWCFQKSNPVVVEDCVLERNLLECNHCGKKIVKCRACNNYAKWDTITIIEDGKEKKKRIKHQFCAEHQHEIPNFETANAKLCSPSEYLTVYEYASTNLSKISKVGGISLASAAVFGPFAFYVARAVGGVVGVAMGYSGAVATNVGLATIGGGAVAAGGAGMAGGAAAITGLGTMLGGGLGAFVGNAYMSSIKGFSIEKIRDGEEPALITINGFLSQEDEGHAGWQEVADSNFTNRAWYHVNWAAKNLAELGKYTTAHTSAATIASVLTKAAQSASKVAAKAIGPAATVYQILQISKNPWHVAFVQAEHTGILLAEIIRRCESSEFVLVGHSLGCRVLSSCLQALSGTEYNGVKKVHLIAGATGNDTKVWVEAKKAVSGSMINYTCQNDKVLKTIYKVGTFFMSKPIGVHSIDVPGIENVDISSYANGHMECKSKAVQFLSDEQI